MRHSEGEIERGELAGSGEAIPLDGGIVARIKNLLQLLIFDKEERLHQSRSACPSHIYDE